MVAARAWQKSGIGALLSNRDRVSVSEDDQVLETDGYTTMEMHFTLWNWLNW